MYKIFLRKSKPSNPGSEELSPPTSDPVQISTVSAPVRSNSGKRMSSAVFPASVVAGIEPLLPFKDVPNSEKLNLFVSKVSLCCVTFDFSDPNKNSIEKLVKRQTLLELLDFVASASVRFTEPAILAMCRMCAVNLFRVFPPSYRSSGGGGGENNDDDEPVFDPAWPHLQIVYDLLLKFITSPCLDAKIAKKYLDNAFIVRLLDLFDSEDPRERECLKTIMHRVYGKFMVHRPFIRRAMSNIFYRFVFETEKHCGVAELLEFLGSIVSGFALPLKEEHKIFLWRVLIPLHKPNSLGNYFQQLSYCITQFIDKEPKLGSVVIKGLLKFWPITNSQKEVMFLGEVEEIVEAMSVVEFQKVMVPLFSRIACCVNSCHFQVSERALFLWNNDQIVNLIAHNRQAILPIMFTALEKNAENHWNQSVLNLTLNVRKMFCEMDEPLFMSCHARFQEDEAEQSSEAEKRKETWERLEKAASVKPITGKTAVLVTPLATSIAC
ncbi:Serine/threonine protein phosphatase 2A 57 kDa regulatory subunit B' iota isoform [Raphanus sativus]|uniref:Serine/threonine protein phosphatase 2A regulatory subunit n=1 Tax=Raphanus sativus TaxID=3726 RepID=A0A6J0NEK0_RAPSA|nr:serine/threonine protein phosphatase 2A 57 kDa regulatory subunit B' kappa isoform [Raphanus sativus]KAJ4900571.1 Serine/threonine protein phosphatase 2A 57 kDa regulatory subunit B' iota isoform [Raphanus sativus]